MPTVVDKMARHLETIPHGRKFSGADFVQLLTDSGIARSSMPGMMRCLRDRNLIVPTGDVIPTKRGGRSSTVYIRTVPLYTEPLETFKHVKVKMKKSAFGDLVKSQLVARHV